MKVRKGETIYNFDLGFVERLSDIGVIFEEMEKARSYQSHQMPPPMCLVLTWKEEYDVGGRLLKAGIIDDWREYYRPGMGF